jgi:hypothetical protein
MTDTTNNKLRSSMVGNECDNVALWKALAQFRSEDLDEGLKLNQEFIDTIKVDHFLKHQISFAILLVFAAISGFFLIGLIVNINSELSGYFHIFLWLSLASFIAPYMWRRASQYEMKINPDKPLDLPHEEDELFEKVIGYLQKVEAPEAFYIHPLLKKKVKLNRRQFFGKLRYFLFSEHGDDRAMVMRFPSAFGLSADVYLHRDEVEKMRKWLKPKRSGGSGRKDKYRYKDAFLELIGDPRIGELNLEDRKAAINTITQWLNDWFAVHPHDSGDVPDDDLLKTYAKRICTNLEKFASAQSN